MKMKNGNGHITGSSGHGKGFSFWTATAFIVGEVAGGGILSLPHATAQAGWFGLVMIIYCAGMAAVSGICLAKAWLILEERYPQYRKGLTRKPFATIGYHTFGGWMSAFVSLLMNITRIGAGTVFLLLSAGLAHTITKGFISLSLCQWIPIMAAIILLPLQLGSPADFWPIAYTAMTSTVVGTILLIIRISMEISRNGMATDFHVESFETFAGAFGIILFAFGGAAAFPNFQNDMKEKEKFPRAVILGFFGLILLYLPTAGLGYAAFGFYASSSIIDDLSGGVVITVVEICFFIHCITVIFIIVNPVFLDLEELFRVPKHFNWRRCLVRTTILLLITFIGESFPSFGQILDLIGSTTIALMAFVLPPIFYTKLVYDQKNNVTWPSRRMPLYHLIVFGLIVLSAIAGGIASCYTTLDHWAPLASACFVGDNWHFNPNSTVKTTH